MIIALVGCFLFGVLSTVLLNLYVVKQAEDYILTADKAAQYDADCIIILGAMVYDQNTLSDILEDRVITGIDLFNKGAADRILMSGDNSSVEYNEGYAMAKYAIKAGIDPDCIFQDCAGFSTYESMYRARDVFQAKRVIIVTQEFHMSRAIYLARSLGLEAYGVTSDLRTYSSEKYNNLREAAARVKAVFTAVTKPEPTFLGDAIPINGKGNLEDIYYEDIKDESSK